MGPIKNPYSPGVSSPPPELAGRDALRENVRIAIARIRLGKPAKSLMLVGLRGVGKTVLLERMRQDAEAAQVHTIRIETPENRSLPALLAPQIRLALIRLNRLDAAKEYAQRGLRALSGFATSLKVKYADIEVELDLDPEPGLADNGDLESDLATLLAQVGQASKKADTALVMFIDELQYVQTTKLAALITALHRCAQDKLPVTMIGAGLPQLRGKAGNAKSYAERLFDYPEVGALSDADATQAIVLPARAEGVEYQSDAVREIVRQTQGYPYFLQEWGKHSWEVATQSPITLEDVRLAAAEAVAALDESFFKVRFDRLTPKEKQYLRAMAELGAGPHRSGDIAAILVREVSSLAPTRNNLINKGMIYSPSHGDTAFTVPLFDEFMRRTIPAERWTPTSQEE